MNRLAMLRSLLLIAASALVAAGCASTQTAGKTGDTTTQPAGPAKPSEPVAISNRAKLRFDDALSAFEAQKKAGAFDYPSLERKFKDALEADQNLAEAEYNLGVLSERQGKLAQARAHYEAALKKKPTLRQAAENLAVMAQNAGDITSAVALYQGILKIFPEDGSSRARLAEIYRQQGDHQKAMEFARAALMRDPQSITAYKVMMRSYVERKQLPMAKLVALRALKINQQDPELYHTIGLILLEEGKKDDARVQFRRALEARADYVPSHVMMAQLEMEAEDYPAAEQHLRRILQSDSKNAAAHVNLGIAYKGQGQYDKAMQEYDEAEKLDPNLPAIAFNRAVLLHRHKGAVDRALELYRKYVSSAGGEITLSAEHPVFNLMREAEQIVQAQREAELADKQARQLEELQKLQQEELKKQEGAQGDSVNNAAGSATAPAAVAPASGKQPAPAAAPAAAPASAPASQKKTSTQADPNEPTDELF